ncbi:MAG: HAD family phosphatase [Ignavibacteria bacterium]|nr:HAD family phosphatase [Ignavibacteria bacterium]
MEKEANDFGVIFDMDGVLIDSEPLYVEMNEELFSELGIFIDKEEYHKFVGMSSPLMWGMIKEEFSLPQSVDELMNREKQRIHELLRSDRLSEPIAGVESLLMDINKAGIPAAVASSSARKNVEMVLSKLDLSGYFKATVCGEDVANGKPAPDIFLKASAAINTAPENCVVIEDSVNGLRGSLAAGMRCIGYAGDPLSKQDLTGADLLVKSFHEEDRIAIMKFISRRH